MRVFLSAIVGSVILCGGASAEPVKVKFGWFASDTDTAYVRVLKPWADAVNGVAKEKSWQAKEASLRREEVLRFTKKSKNR